MVHQGEFVQGAADHHHHHHHHHHLHHPRPPSSPQPIHILGPSESEMCNVLHRRHGELDREFLYPVPKFVAENEGSGAVVAVRNVANPALMCATIVDRERRHTLPFTELGLPQITDNRTINLADVKGEEAMHHRCDVCDNVPIADMFTRYNADSHLRIHKSQTTPLHVACTLPFGASWVKILCAKGARVNEQNQDGQTPLHLVLLGDIQHHKKNMEDCISTLLQCGADVNIQDKEGETPLLYLRTFLKRGLYEEAADLGRVLLQHGGDPNVVNRQGRSLLTYSVYHLDDCIALSRLLLNHGATVWYGTKEDIDQSSFSWFLKSIIQLRRLENCGLTLKLLCQVMGESPKRMHAHVLRTMFRHVRCFRVLGPVFLQLKLAMMRYWSQPHDLKYLCWRTVRRSLGPKRIVSATPRLGLPRSLQKYVLME